ncbi:hypothetical protein ACFFTM_21740 [Pseudoduganella plicata]|uniref:Uncharacterized protein n=1 Tax=Pseudoduganella plicata TaxID=321984 RepID=A0A4P7BGV1_9BURK|nr:hypothetical protein [Pseudoduganella plicata]QBQ38016.1 hypothetical protein E1742_18855 [Pseudoduganella plicata]GGZ03681.1 hypothetical protein GCM10007388_41750 [Pseudoduganella plicata]
MRILFISMLLAMPLVSNAAQPPQQTSTLPFSEVSTYDENDVLQPVALQVLSDTAGATTVTTEGLIKSPVQEWEDWGSHGADTLSLNLAPKAGYRITGFSMSSHVAGDVFIPDPPGGGHRYYMEYDPIAETSWGIFIEHTDWNGTRGTGAENVRTPSLLTFAIHDLAIVDAQTFEFAAWTFISKRGSFYYWVDPETGDGVERWVDPAAGCP